MVFNLLELVKTLGDEPVQINTYVLYGLADALNACSNFIQSFIYFVKFQFYNILLAIRIIAAAPLSTMKTNGPTLALILKD